MTPTTEDNQKAGRYVTEQEMDDYAVAFLKWFIVIPVKQEVLDRDIEQFKREYYGAAGEGQKG